LQHPDKSQKHFCSSEPSTLLRFAFAFSRDDNLLPNKYFLKEKTKKKKAPYPGGMDEREEKVHLFF
jgi:hypothetical protein